MSRTKDEVTLWIRRGTPKSPEMAIAGLWLQYRIKEIVAHYRILLEDNLGLELTQDYPAKIIQKIVYAECGVVDEAGPMKYCISGKCKDLGSEKMWKAMMSDIGEMLSIAESFMEGASMSTKYSTKIRPEWFTYDNERGLLANCSKPLTIHPVGKSCRLSNSDAPKMTMPVFGAESVYFDVRVKNVWAVGEACSAGKLASAARKEFKETHTYQNNDNIFSSLASKMDRNSVLVVQCEPVVEGDLEWITIHPKPWQFTESDIGPQIRHYAERMEKWLDSEDPFEHLLSERNHLDPIELVKLVRDAYPSVGYYTNHYVTEVLHRG
jgi:hypothetical protein